MSHGVELHFFCGKAAAGKSSLSKQVASGVNSILLSEDLWLSKLYPSEINKLQDYVQRSNQLKSVLFEHISALLNSGLSVVLDFPGNTVEQRLWFKSLIESVKCAHVLHYIKASDALCRQQLHQRNQNLPEGNAPLSDELFNLVNSYFQEPEDSEGFIVKQYERS